MKAVPGEHIKLLRLKAGFGLTAFARLVDMRPSELAAVEHGRASLLPESLAGVLVALGSRLPVTVRIEVS